MNRVLVLFGGASTEHAISQRSAYNIVRGLRSAGLQVAVVGITRNGDFLSFNLADEEILDDAWAEKAQAEAEKALAASVGGSAINSVRAFLENLAGGPVDVIFPAVHGVNCEDGVLQGFLEMSGIPYVGCGVMSSAVCMDKLTTKSLVSLAGIPQVEYVALEREEIGRNLSAAVAKVSAELAYPCFVKPSNGGSSIGTAAAANAEELAEALQHAAKFDRHVLVEAFVDARELEVAVMGNSEPVAAVVAEVRVQDDIVYYDFDTKYNSATGASLLIPAPLAEEEAESLRSMALRIYKTLSCRGLARVDFFKSKADGKIYFNELNNLPGFTEISLFPQAFAYVGYDQPKLLRHLCELAVEAYAADRKALS